jgi:hypothetical protein
MSVATAVAGALVMAGVARAHHDEPSQARFFTSSLVRAYETCDGADVNAMTPGGLPACTPGEALDTVCNMDGDGAKGMVDITPEQHDLRVKVVIHGITGCEGERLLFFVDVNVTSDNCVDLMGKAVQDNCTLVGPNTIPLGDCIVANGRCSMDTTLETLFPFINALGGNDIGFRIDRCEIVRLTGGMFVPFLRCGVLIP